MDQASTWIRLQHAACESSTTPTLLDRIRAGLWRELRRELRRRGDGQPAREVLADVGGRERRQGRRGPRAGRSGRRAVVVGSGDRQHRVRQEPSDRDLIASTPGSRAHPGSPTIATSRTGPRYRSSAQSAWPNPVGALPITSRTRRRAEVPAGVVASLAGEVRQAAGGPRRPPSSRWAPRCPAGPWGGPPTGLGVRARLEEAAASRCRGTGAAARRRARGRAVNHVSSWVVSYSVTHAAASSAWSSAKPGPPGHAVPPRPQEPCRPGPQMRQHERCARGRPRRRSGVRRTARPASASARIAIAFQAVSTLSSVPGWTRRLARLEQDGAARPRPSPSSSVGSSPARARWPRSRTGRHNTFVPRPSSPAQLPSGSWRRSTPPAGSPDQLDQLVPVPREELAFDALGVGVLGGEEPALGMLHLAQQVLDRLGRDAAVSLLAG